MTTTTDHADGPSVGATEVAPGDDQGDRLEALRRRRELAAGGRAASRPAGSVPRGSAAPEQVSLTPAGRAPRQSAKRKGRRLHVAAGARIAATGLGLTATFTLVAAMGRADAVGTTADPEPVAQPAGPSVPPPAPLPAPVPTLEVLRPKVHVVAGAAAPAARQAPQPAASSPVPQVEPASAPAPPPPAPAPRARTNGSR